MSINFIDIIFLSIIYKILLIYKIVLLLFVILLLFRKSITPWIFALTRDTFWNYSEITLLAKMLSSIIYKKNWDLEIGRYIIVYYF